VTINLQFVTVSSLFFIGAAVTLSAPMKTSSYSLFITVWCAVLSICIFPSAAHAQFFIGIDAVTNVPSHTLDVNTDGADTAFHSWAAAAVGGSNHFNQWTGAGAHASGILSGTGSAKLVMDTGVNATSPFGLGTGSVNAPNPPVTRNYGSSFSYTVYNVLYADNNPVTWATNPGLGTSLTSHIAGTAATLAGRHVPGNFNKYDPANQDGDNVSPDGRDMFGFAGIGNADVSFLGVPSLTSSLQRKSGFVLEFSNPISAFGVFAADFEATNEGTANRYRASAFFYDANMNLIQYENWGNDGNQRESFMGIIRSTADIKYAMFIVGARDGIATDGGRDSSARSNHYAFGGFTFLQAEIPEPRVYAVMAILALCIGWRERRRLLALIKKIKPTSQPNPS
jgi:hypothetical protein